MLDRETTKQAEALALQLIRIKGELRLAGDDEGAIIAASVVDALCDVIDLGWVRKVRAQV